MKESTDACTPTVRALVEHCFSAYRIDNSRIEKALRRLQKNQPTSSLQSFDIDLLLRLMKEESMLPSFGRFLCLEYSYLRDTINDFLSVRLMFKTQDTFTDAEMKKALHALKAFYRMIRYKANTSEWELFLNKKHETIPEGKAQLLSMSAGK